jgi:dihydrofolate reductase
LTLVHADSKADTFFPDYEGDRWMERESEQHAADEKNQYPFTFKLLVKKAS